MNKTAPLLTRLGSTILARRRILQMSQAELADRSNVQREYISAVERGEQNLTVLSLRRIAHALNTEVSTLLKQADKEFAQVA